MDTKDPPGVLWGAGAIAAYVFGEDTTKNRRRIYHLASKGHLPVNHVGNTITTTEKVARRVVEPC